MNELGVTSLLIKIRGRASICYINHFIFISHIQFLPSLFRLFVIASRMMIMMSFFSFFFLPMLKAHEVRIEANDWVNKETDGLIENLIPETAVSDMTRLLITNAL